MGMSMKIERSSLDDVKKRFEINAKKKEESKKEFNFEERMKQLKDDEAKAKAKKNEMKKEKKAQAEQIYQATFNGDDTDMMAVMGFTNFTSSKK